eukprot:gene26817-34650_t
MIRAHALTTDVPRGGSVRSGAVDVFGAGIIRHAAPDADFGVHAWQDDIGRGPGDFAADAPVNRAYLAYYHAMGMDLRTAAAFYALTNSAPNTGVRWLHTADIARFVSSSSGSSIASSCPLRCDTNTSPISAPIVLTISPNPSAVA